MAEPKSRLELLLTFVQVVSVVFGIVVSVLSLNATRDKEIDARIRESDARRLEAERPFRELRRSVYLEAVKTAAIIANPDGRSNAEISKAQRRFRELYVAELTMVEDRAVETGMVALAGAVDPALLKLSAGQNAAYNLAKALSASYNDSLTVAGQK